MRVKIAGSMRKSFELDRFLFGFLIVGEIGIDLIGSCGEGMGG